MINIQGLQFDYKLIDEKKTPYGFSYLKYEIYFNDKLKCVVVITTPDIRANQTTEGLLINKMKENRIIKGMITHKIHKDFLERKNNLKEVKNSTIQTKPMRDFKPNNLFMSNENDDLSSDIALSESIKADIIKEHRERIKGGLY
jgi:hypothetical protein